MTTRISPAKAEQRLALNVLPAAVAAPVLHVLCKPYLDGGAEGALRIALAVLPALPVLWMLWSVHRYLSRTDELHRRVHMAALGVAAGVTAACSIVYGLLEESAGLPHLSARWAILVLGLSWVVSGFVLWRRYK